MQLLQKIPKNISLEKERYEWQLVAHNRRPSNWAYAILKVMVIAILVVVEGLLMYKLWNSWAAIWRTMNWSWLLMWGSQLVMVIFIIWEIGNELRRDLDRQLKTLRITLKNDVFSIAVKGKSPFGRAALPQKTYARNQLQEVYYYRGEKKKAAEISAKLLNKPQELFVCAEEQEPEAWGRFLEAEQTQFLTLLLRAFYQQKQVDQQILLAPIDPISAEDFEDLSQHLIL